MQTQFTWDPQHEALVRAKWQEKTRIRLKDKVYKDGKPSPSKIITWMTDDLRMGLKDKREHDLTFKARSKRNRKKQSGRPES